MIRVLSILILAPLVSSAQDTVVLKNGRKADCQIIDFTTDAVKISFRSTPAAVAEVRSVPLADVDYVELAPLPGEKEAYTRAIKEGKSEPLMEFWAKRIAWLGRPRCNAGELGLTYAELLTRVPTPDRMDRALKVYQQIETEDWNPGRKGRAQAGQLRVMLRQGRVSEVKPLAEALVEKSGDPRVLIELRHVMAEVSAASLTQMEKDHPRWREEDDLVPEHARLLNEALDGYLFPHLFYGTEEDLAARGLWAASQLSQSQKELPQASEWALDLTMLYHEAPESSAAAAFLIKQPIVILTKPQPVAEEAPPESASDGEKDSVDEPKARSNSKAASKTKKRPKKSAGKLSKTEEKADE